MILYSYFILFISILSAFNNPKVSEHSIQSYQIGNLPSINAGGNPGVAGAFSGISEGKLIIAGGANLPDKMPWAGGTKIFHDRIYIYSLKNDEFKLIDSNQTFPEKVAYGSSVTLPEGILTIGGNNLERCFDDVHLLRWNNNENKIEIEQYPSLPFPLSNCSSVLVNNCVFVLGGSKYSDTHSSGNYFLKLDLSRKSTAEFKWEILPEFPGLGRVLAVVCSQYVKNQQYIFLFSGRHISEKNEITVLTDGICYDLKQGKWLQLPAINFEVMAGTAFARNKSEIVLIGGAPANLFYKEIDLKNKVKEYAHNTDQVKLAQKTLIDYYLNHPGFSHNIMVFSTAKNTLVKIGEFSDFCPVTTNAIPFKDGVILPSGEIKPGIRTPKIFYVGNKNPFNN